MFTKIIHRLIVWYLYRCGGAFHTFPYGDEGRYVVLMADWQYSRLGALGISRMTNEDYHRLVWLSRAVTVEELAEPEGE